jgi:cytochrome c oxidase assembly factor CtaG
MTRCLLFLFAARAVWPHAGEPLEPHDLWQAWTWDPLIVAFLALSAGAYLTGASRARGIARWEAVCFWAGWMTLFLALLSPLHPMGEVLFSAHMAQHELIMAVAAPLLVLGRPLVPFLWSVPEHVRRRAGAAPRRPWFAWLWARVANPFGAWAIHFLALWAWHIPALFQATIASDLVHAAQHISFLGSALLFWWALIRGHGAQRRYGAAVFYIFTTAVHTSILGAWLTFAPSVWYPAYSTTTPAWGLTPLEDQQLGGLIMWVPAGLTYLVAALVLFYLWIERSERFAFAEGK